MTGWQDGDDISINSKAKCYMILNRDWRLRWHIKSRENLGLSQGVTKTCRLSLLTNSALVIRVQMRGEGGSCRVSANEYSCAHHVTWSPNKLWRSTSIFNLWFMVYHVARVQLLGKRHKNIRTVWLITEMFYLTIYLQIC